MAASESHHDFQTRAAEALYRPPTARSQDTPTSPQTIQSPHSLQNHYNEKHPHLHTPSDSGPKSGIRTSSVSSFGNTLDSSSVNTVTENEEKQRHVRTLPTWVQSFEEDADDNPGPNVHLLSQPPSAQVAHHHYLPSTSHKPAPGRLYDAQRERTPVTMNSPDREDASRWQTFVKVSAYPPSPAEGCQHVDADWLRENLPDLEQPWLASAQNGQDAQAEGVLGRKPVRRKWWKRPQQVLLRNPMVPLIIRLFVWCFSLFALGLGANIYHLSRVYDCAQRPSTYMAIIVDAVALIYILYITYDEYRGKPLGLRSPGGKMRLIFLDLFFIVFDSANISLAFEALTDSRWACQVSNNIDQSGSRCGGQLVIVDLCHRQKALSSVLLIALIAWLLTFSVSVLRLVERVTQS
ncbi:hypothetical protein L228DRAFT_117095 [Xylona heveae TC161]|uniref:Regulator of phospholipase D SRF1 n=1 Tax=Xylona heveae (strain CBS 132557 / TC161) TaxID=1328760 RepID=A0A165HGF0_XYLHT|nr:hypothetical protein L228DRAFT_117095 [Xylona heveae TC161]KZF23473.1 hypothetical protein L228DRAFT_117095 [Xylona heveae TC161]